MSVKPDTTNNGVNIGALIDASPNFYQPVPCAGSFNEITLSLFDQSGNPLALIDPNGLFNISAHSVLDLVL